MEVSKSSTIYYSSFTDLNKFKVSLLHEEATEIESTDFVGLRNSPKGYIYTITNISVEISMHISILTTMKASFFEKEIQKSAVVIEMTI